jgi:hypothetical protein
MFYVVTNINPDGQLELWNGRSFTRDTRSVVQYETRKAAEDDSVSIAATVADAFVSVRAASR